MTREPSHRLALMRAAHVATAAMAVGWGVVARELAAVAYVEAYTAARTSHVPLGLIMRDGSIWSPSVESDAATRRRQ